MNTACSVAFVKYLKVSLLPSPFLEYVIVIFDSPRKIYFLFIFYVELLRIHFKISLEGKIHVLETHLKALVPKTSLIWPTF